MADKFQQYNIKLIEWLNESYDKKQGSSDLLWALNPVVFIALCCRIFLMLLKIVLKIFNIILPFGKRKSSQRDNTSGEAAPEDSSDIIQFKDIFRISFINILLYRKQYVVRNRGSYESAPLLEPVKMRLMSVEFKQEAKPLVSIIIPIYNKIEYTFNCLLALKKNVSDKVSYEVIVVNDKSTDESESILSRIKGLVLINNENNLGFILSCNKGAEAAKGQYLCFLNNDTEVQPNWLESMLQIFDRYPDAGLVGSMLIYPSNQLQEAGGVIWRGASGMNYGRLQDYLDPRYNFVRPVDYCSGASILVKKTDFETLGGFEKEFVPAYYEDTDLCFAIRNKLGKKVYYQPESKLIHHEGITSGTSTSSGTKRYQDINAEKFKLKWKHELQQHLPDLKSNNTEGALRLCGEKTILIIDSYVPAFDKESGSCRMFHLIKILKQLRYHVIFVPDNGVPENPYTMELQQMGVEVLYHTGDFKASLISQIRERLFYIDIAWVCRPLIVKRYMPVLKMNPKIKIIYDTIDLHYIRLKREAELHPERKEQLDWIKMKDLEQKNGIESDLTIAITDTDKETLLELGVTKVDTIPNVHVPNINRKPTFEERSGILFIGGYNHKPNVDAVIWLCKEIMPKVWAKHPDLKVTLLGSSPSEKVKALAGPNVIVTGFISDVSDYFLNSRIFVAPLTYGAGMKGKIGQSLEYALPVVSTSIGVEGMNLKHNHNCLVADDTDHFAAEIIRLYFDKNLWEKIAANSHEALYPFSPDYIKEKMSGMLEMLTER